MAWGYLNRSSATGEAAAKARIISPREKENANQYGYRK